MAITDIAYVVFDHTDLDAAERYYTDFGLTVAYRTSDEIGFRPAMERGYCYVACKAAKPGLRAIAFNASERADLEAAARFPEASPILAIEREGGGAKVMLKSPDGLPFEIVHGIKPYPKIETRAALTFNTGHDKPRRGEFQRAPKSQAPVLRLGHIALLTNNFQANFEWMQSRLGLRPTDIMFGEDKNVHVGSFMHVGGAQDWTDHHTLALFPDPHPRVHHISFELEDLDAQGMSNMWMTQQGWKPVWGIGRHIYGSQIFDYWFDPDGNITEHFTDGDMVRPGSDPSYCALDDDSLFAWGPPMQPAHFVSLAARHE